jgi:hypothetical protein
MFGLYGDGDVSARFVSAVGREQLSITQQCQCPGGGGGEIWRLRLGRDGDWDRKSARTDSFRDVKVCASAKCQVPSGLWM